MKKKLLLTASLLALTSGSALAADLGRGGLKDGPAYDGGESAARSWTGFWLGALGGYQIANSKIDAGSEWHCEDYRESENISIDGAGQQGLFGELQLGYDYQINKRLVAGVFGGLNINNAEFSINARQSFSDGETTRSDGASILSFEQKWGGVIGPRLGYLTSPSTMFYVAGGWAFGEMGKVKSGGKDVFTEDNGFSHGQDTSLSGLFGEVGMESRLDGNLYLKVAGRLTSYGSLDLASEAEGDADHGSSAHIDLDHDVLAGMVGVTYKIGGGL